jgi:hypothetical protein
VGRKQDKITCFVVQVPGSWSTETRSCWNFNVSSWETKNCILDPRPDA